MKLLEFDLFMQIEWCLYPKAFVPLLRLFSWPLSTVGWPDLLARIFLPARRDLSVDDVKSIFFLFPMRGPQRYVKRNVLYTHLSNVSKLWGVW